MVPPHNPVVQLGGSDRAKAGVALVEVGPLTEDVNHDHDHIKPMHFRKLHDELHRDGVSALIWNLGRMELTMGKLLEHLCPVACITGSDVLADMSGQLGPPVVPGDKLQPLKVASMPGNPHVVVLLHDPAMEVLIPWYNNLAAKQEEFVQDFYSAE